MQNEKIISAGNDYIQRGFSIVPVKGKTSCVEWLERQETPFTSEEFRELVLKNNPTGLGIVCGKVSGIVIVDIDTEEHEITAKFPNTPTVKTSRGSHFYFRYPAEGIKSSKPMPKVEIRSDGNYTIAPPSIHESGIEYQWLVSLDTEMADFPVSLFETKAHETVIQKSSNWETILAGVKEGERHNALVRITGKLLHGIPEAEWPEIVWPTMQLINEKNIPPLDSKEVESIYKSISQSEREKRQEKNKGNSNIKIISIKELFGKTDGERKFLIDKLITDAGLNILAGNPGVGKSWIMLEMAKAVATGEKFLGKFDVMQGPVLIVDGESRESELRARMKKLNFSENLPIYIASQQGIKVDNEDTVNYLLPKIKEFGIKFIILDPFSAIHNKTENSSDEMQKVMEGLETFSKEGVTVMFLHHNRKEMAGHSSSASQSLRGSSVILSRVDSMSSVKKEDENEAFIRMVYSQEKLRTGKREKPFEIFLEEDEAGIHLKCGERIDVEETKSETAIEKILEMLNETPMSRKEILIEIKKLDIKERTTSQAIRILEKSGSIVKEKVGKENRYTLSAKNSQLVPTP